METRGKMKFYTHSEILDRTIGEKGTPDRNEYDAEMYLFHLGEMIKETRLAKSLTQEELGKGLRANIEIENIGTIPLCGI